MGVRSRGLQGVMVGWDMGLGFLFWVGSADHGKISTQNYFAFHFAFGVMWISFPTISYC